MKQFMLTYAHLCFLMLTYLQKFNPLLIGSLNCTISCPYMRSVYKVTYYTRVISETLLSLVQSTLGFKRDTYKVLGCCARYGKYVLGLRPRTLPYLARHPRTLYLPRLNPRLHCTNSTIMFHL